MNKELSEAVRERASRAIVALVRDAYWEQGGPVLAAYTGGLHLTEGGRAWAQRAQEYDATMHELRCLVWWVDDEAIRDAVARYPGTLNQFKRYVAQVGWDIATKDLGLAHPAIAGPY